MKTRSGKILKPRKPFINTCTECKKEWTSKRKSNHNFCCYQCAIADRIRAIQHYNYHRHAQDREDLH